MVIARRVIAGLAVLAAVAATVPVLLALPHPRSAPILRVLARGMLRALGVRYRLVGGRPHGAALLAANHVSWLDVLAVLAAAPARLLAKQEVRRWPLIGAAAAAAGTIFIDRFRPKRLPEAVAEVAAALRAGAVVAVFPEGTTWCGRAGGPLRPAMFQAAIDARAPVVPVALRYLLIAPDGTVAPTTAAAFLGDQALLDSLRRVITVSGLTVTLRAGPPLSPEPGSGNPPATGALPAAGNLPATGRRQLADRTWAAVHSPAPPARHGHRSPAATRARVRRAVTST